METIIFRFHVKFGGVAHRIHWTGIFNYHKNQSNVAKYTSPMDPMGRGLYDPVMWGLFV